MKRAVLTAFALALCFTAHRLEANIVGNPSFEAGLICAGGCDVAGQEPWIFTAAGGGSSLFGIVNGPSGGGAPAPPDGNKEAFFGNISVGVYDTISQTLTTVPSQLYTLTFWLNTAQGHTLADFRVLWDGVEVYDDPAGSDLAHQFPYTLITVPNLQATGTSTVLAFQGYNQPALDFFDAVDVEAQAPEPGTWMLMLAGVVVVMLRTRLRGLKARCRLKACPTFRLISSLVTWRAWRPAAP